MPAKQSNHLGAIVATLFTSLIAPTLVCLVTNAIKANVANPSLRETSPAPQSATFWPELPPPAAVTLLPPTIAQSPPPANSPDSRTATLAKPLTWKPAN